MKTLGDKRPDEKADTKKKARVGVSPGAKAQPQDSNQAQPESFDESVEL